jgi:hypothetical protein
MTISRRTKTLAAMGSLAPISIIGTRIQLASSIAKAKREGAISIWIDPGLLPKLLLLLGLASVVAAAISFVFDMRRVR